MIDSTARKSPFARALVLLLHGYRSLISPLLGPHCRFYPSCSQYAIHALERRPLLTAFGLILKRLVRCHPFHPGGYDPLESDEIRSNHPSDENSMESSHG